MPPTSNLCQDDACVHGYPLFALGGLLRVCTEQPPRGNGQAGGIFRNFGRASVLLGTLAFNVGPAKLLGNGRYPKSRLIKKLEAGDRDIYHEYVAFCHYKGKRHAMLLKRRKAEFALLYVP